jgi:hypothetical protein
VIEALKYQIEARWQVLLRFRFVHLVRHCAKRIFYGGEGAESGEMDLGIGALLALLAAPGAFISVGLFFKYGSLFRFLSGNLRFDPYVASLPDEYFFIVLSMVVAGSVAVWKWNSLLPDGRDFATLAPLPLRSSAIFAANLGALLLLVVLLAFDINAASSVLFPLIASALGPSSANGPALDATLKYFGVFLATHLLSVILAAAFGFLAVLTILGLLMAFLPFRVFQKASVWVRCAILTFFAALLLTSFSEPQQIQRFENVHRSWIFFPPPAWFAALCQSLRGVHRPLFATLRVPAVLSVGCAFFLSMAAYALSYRRCFLRSAEAKIVLPAGGGAAASLGFRFADKLALPSPFERACYRFTLKTFFRSEPHALTWIGLASIGVITTAETMLSAASPVLAGATQASRAAARLTTGIPSEGVLGIPLALTFFLLVGVRMAFEIPAPLRANWVFRLGVDPVTQRCAGLARRVMLTFEAPLWVACFAGFAYFWGWRIAVAHTAVVVAMTLLLIETLLLKFRKIPFTCSAPRFKGAVIPAVLIYVVSFYAFSGFIPGIEREIPRSPLLSVFEILALLLIWAGCIYKLSQNVLEIDRYPIFEHFEQPAVEVLDLTFRR